MNIFELPLFSLMNTDYHVPMDGLGHFARIIIEGVGILGLGIIVFAIVLKAITLPFDIYQRVKMRKQTLIMRQMQPELEKLQKQYANDKDMYSKKMMELYKKNGYSMLGACLPMIISMVILIVAFQGFRVYSQYANIDMYQKMSKEYNAALTDYIADGQDFFLPSGTEIEDGELKKLAIDLDEWKSSATHSKQTITKENIVTEYEGWTKSVDGLEYTVMSETSTTQEEGENKTVTLLNMYVRSEDSAKFISYRYSLDNYHPEDGKTVSKYYLLETDRVYGSSAKYAYDEKLDKEQQPLSAKEYVDATVHALKDAAASAETTLTEDQIAAAQEEACADYVIKIGARNARAWYKKNNSSFMWIKNVWYPDVSYNHPIQSYQSYTKEFKSTKVVYDGTKDKLPLTTVLNEGRYEYLVSELGEYTKAPNGYFILIILSIGFMVLSQFISMKSQKETNKYQTADGSGAASQKMMMIIMPLIYAVFSFMYSAAFSIYMTMSSVISILVTLLSNLIIGHVFKKKEESALKEKYTRELPWQKKDKGGKKDKKGKK